MEQPLVTIGAIGYNNASYVIETLDSIKNQTYGNIELIITDDCSTDESVVGIIKEWLKDYDKPYQFIINEKNKGGAAACNAAIHAAKGKYISLVATDDILMPDKTRVQVEILENADIDVGVVYSDAYMIDEKSALKDGMFIQLKNLNAPPSGDVYDSILNGDLWFHGAAALIKAECYKKVGLYEDWILSEDIDILLRLSRQYKFIFSEYVSEKYRVRGDSLTRTNTWYASQIQVFARNIPYSKVALSRMDAAAASAYVTDDKKALDILPQYKHLSIYIEFILMLKKARIPKAISRVLLFCLRKYLQAYRFIVS
jgi:glycosyltransferase involved in cell wall biosynthesis